MRIAIIGQQAFGKATLDAFLARGDTVVAAFCAPDTSRGDPLRDAAVAAGVPVFSFPKLTSPEAIATLREAAPDIGVMAYVTQFVSQAFTQVPRLGTIQFHPSLLPDHRGASAMSWAIALGRTETGFTVFRPTAGLDEGPVLLQRSVPIGPDDSLGTVYFERIFPAGVAGLLEVADGLQAGTIAEKPQPEGAGGYEGVMGEAESQISWSSHVDLTFNLIRGCDPAPGAWTTAEGRRLQLFDCRKRPARTFSEVKGKRAGEVVAAGGGMVTIFAQGGFIVARRLRWQGCPKIAADTAGLLVGTVLGR